MQRRAGKFFDSALFSDDERTHIERKLDARSYKEPVKESKSGMKSEFGMMEMGKLKTEAHGFDDDSKGLSDKSSFRYGQPSHSRTSTEAQDTVQNFIEQFVRMLCERSGTGIYRDITTIRRSQEYSMQALEEALGVYATQLLSVTAAVINKSVGGVKRDDTIMLFGAVLIQHYKFPIAHCFRECLSGVRALENPNAKFTLQQMGPPNFSPTLLGLTEKPMIVLDKSTMDHPLFISAINVVELSEYLESKITALELNDMMRLLGSADEMQLLAPCVRRSLYLDTNSAMQIIEAMMSEENLLHSGGHHYEAEIHLPWWSIENFMIDEYEEDYEEDIPPFGSVVTLTGSSPCAQALTCADYVKMTWPHTGAFFLKLLDAIHTTFFLKDPETPSEISLTSDRGLFVRAHTCGSDDHDICVSFTARAVDHDLLVQLAQQLSWLTSAFTTSPFKEKLAQSSPLFSQKHQGVFDIASFHEPVNDSEQICWLSLFNSACIVAGFPISDRAGEVGLEVSLELLAGLSGARHVFEYEGGLVMKGFSHMFVPVRRQLDRVQWHAVSSSDEETPLSYQDGISCCGPRARLHEVGLQDLSLLRAIVGWCSVATTCLGSTHAKYENIDYTKATEANSAPRCTGTSFGFQQFGVAALDVKFGLKDGKSHFQRAGPYRRIVQLADSSPIVLHDIEDKRSWLVPATNVMLHIVQHRHHLDPFQVNGQSISLDTNISRGSSAKNVLLKNRDQVLYEDDKHTFMNEILDIWSTLEFLLAQNISREREAPGLPIPSSFHGSLYGFEFKAIVNQDAPYNLKKTSIKRTHGGWKKLIEDIDALVLFANGLGDVILPAGEHNQDLCSRWRKVPHGQDYLATTTNMLQTLFDKAGSREDQEYLTTKSKIRWHQGSNALFDVCQNPDLCDCTRVQQLVPESAMRTVQRPTSIASEGAVVFGRPEPRRAPPRPAEPHNSNSLYSQPNVPIVPRMVRRRGSTDDERRVRIRRLDVEVEESSRERNHQLQAIS
ncbi:unnamed protein product [Alternaria alternata]